MTLSLSTADEFEAGTAQPTLGFEVHNTAGRTERTDAIARLWLGQCTERRLRKDQGQRYPLRIRGHGHQGTPYKQAHCHTYIQKRGRIQWALLAEPSTSSFARGLEQQGHCTGMMDSLPVDPADARSRAHKTVQYRRDDRTQPGRLHDPSGLPRRDHATARPFLSFRPLFPRNGTNLGLPIPEVPF